ncbi:MAG: hypothetical protein N2515_11105 [Deltaproteobacteria bacterium]|nr:hypothetical protein [Deltaproteobacteria bacterium]
MSQARGRVVVVFYENREHARDNEDFKYTLAQFIRDNQLQKEINVYAVANLLGVDGLSREIARGIVRAVARSYGIELLMDWEGQLQRPPFLFPNDGSTIALFDREGRLRYRFTGRIDTSKQSEIFRLLRRLLRTQSTPSASSAR